MADTQANSTLGDLLESISDYDLNKRTYAAILKHLEAENRLKSSDFEKLLTLCLHEYSKKKTLAISSLKILSSILKKEDKEHNNSSQLVKLLVAVLDNLKTNASVVKICALKALCFEIVLSFPDKCLIMGVDEYANEFYTVIEKYCHESSVEVVEQILILTLKLLTILPADKKSKFIRDGINTWFSSLIPTIFKIAKENSSGLNAALEVLGVLSNELSTKPKDYVKNIHFKSFLSKIPSQYAPIILNLFKEDQYHWAPLWIATVNLLKFNITADNLNALLQVEENAFKSDHKNRCLAFECWRSFIDNFTAQSERVLIRRTKLLAVPLLSFNARCEDTAFAKLGTWWHFMVRLCGKCDVLSDYIQPFLTFCFGSPPPSNRNAAPGMMSSRTRNLGLQAFANILGHHDCLCSGELERPKTAIVAGEHLVEDNKNWLHHFGVALDICVEWESERANGYLKCAWKSLLLKTCDLPSETSRREQMFSELLEVLEKSLQKCCFNTSKITIDELLPALFELDKETTKALVEGEGLVFRRLQAILADSCNNNFYLSCDIDKTTKKVGAFTDYALENGRSVGLDNLLESLPSSESGVLLWSCYVESTMKYKYFSNSRWIVALVMWPIEQNIVSNTEKYSATWISFYDLLDEGNVKDESSAKITHSVNDRLLSFLSGNRSVNTPLRLTSVVSLVKQDFKERGASARKPDHLALKILSKQIDDELIGPTIYWHLLDCLKSLIDAFALHKVVVDLKKLLLVANTTLKVTPKVLSTLEAGDTESLHRVEYFLKSIHDLIKIDEYSKSSVIIVEGMKRLAAHLVGRPSALSNPVKLIFSSLISHEDGEIKSLARKMSPEVDAKETNGKSTPSRNSKKSVNIVKTVVENGEEFVQIESNWKFNPKKLTEHQKEKLQSKREDIPALYQDLSQSQDEIKLRTWKTDTTETTSSSNSCAAIDRAVFDVTRSPKAVPEVMKTNDLQSSASKNSDISKVTPKIKHSPRLLLKDRVTRNVKNLAEKSFLSKDSVSELLVVCDKLPSILPAEAKLNSENAPNSAASVAGSTKEKICSISNHRVTRNVKNLAEKSFLSKDSVSELVVVCDKLPSILPAELKLNSENAPNSAASVTGSTKVKICSISNHRVTRNVKNLAEKSFLSKDSVSELVVVCDKLPSILPAEAKLNSENAPNSAASVTGSTNEKICSNNNVAESASPLPIAAERPSRKRKPPNKYIDSNIFGYKRRSNQNTNSAVDTILNSYPLRKNSDSLKLADGASRFTDNDSPVGTEDAPHGDENEVASPKTVNRQNAKESGTKPFKRSGSKGSRIKKLLAIDMVKSTLPIVRIDNGSYATRNKSKMTPAAEECRPAPDSASQDIIESSQDSSVTAVSVVSTKNGTNRASVSSHNEDKSISDFRDSFEDTSLPSDVCDSVLPDNVTVLRPNLSAEEADSEVFDAQTDLTEALDTEPTNTQYGAQIEDECELTSETNHCVESSTQSTADADTIPVNFTIDIIKEEVIDSKANEFTKLCPTNSSKRVEEVSNAAFVSSVDARPPVESTEPTERRDEASSPLKNDERRRRDFLDDTLEISPIRTMSPLMRERTPSPETSGDYVVVNLTSSVLLNGEPADPVDSPEVFTEDNTDARDPSPPRGDTAGSEGGSGSGPTPKRKPRVRPAGRAAQMLGLCVAPDETSRSTIRNLKRSADVDSSDEADDGEPFLRLGRVLPAVDSSPCGPILKRKHAVIAEDSTPSPAGKRKRVSFHDPPVSTSVCVKKYIDPSALRSPQSSAPRRPDRPDGSLLRPLGQTFKSQRRLDKILAKTVESILSGSTDVPDSLSGRTPPAGVPDPSDLDDRDPTSGRLTECEDPVENVASDSSPPPRPSVETFEGTVAVGELAPPTEVDLAGVERPHPPLPKADHRKADAGVQSDAPEVSSVSSQTDEEHRSERTGGDRIRESDVAGYLSANPNVAMALDERGLEALSAAFVRRLLRDEGKMAEFVVSLLRERFETKDAIAYWCNILKTITDSP